MSIQDDNAQQPATPPTTPHAPVDEQLQREIDAAMGGQSVAELMSQPEAASVPEAAEAQAQAEGDGAPASGGEKKRIEHEIRRGRISGVRDEDVFVELAGAAGKMQGVVPLKQFERPPRVGSIMDFVVDKIDEAEGLVHLSREGAISTATWAQLDKGAIVEARVVATNKGGLELELVGRIRAFMPASQVDLHHVDDLEPLVGQKIVAKVHDVDRRAKKVVLSRRQYLEEEKARKRAQLWKEIEVGQERDGVVTSIADYGVFVDIGGTDGLVHVTDLSYTHVPRPADVVKVGQPVRVKVLKLDEEKKRISLGMKQVTPDPWEGLPTRVKVGDQVGGRVVRTAPFGAFVEVEPGVEGLLPISELSWRRVNKVEDEVKVSDTLRLAVIAFDPEKRRLTLSLKQAQGDPWIGASRKYENGTVHQATVKSVTDFGAFVELEPGVEGLVHISELSPRRVDKVEDVAPVGSTHEVRVLEIDEDQRRVRLSIKAVLHPPEERKPAEQPAPDPKAAAKRKPVKPGNLRGGITGGALGMGLGNLKL